MRLRNGDGPRTSEVARDHRRRQHNRVDPAGRVGTNGCRGRRVPVSQFLLWLERERGLTFDDYAALWRWSVDELEQFWDAVWHFFDSPPLPLLGCARHPGMPGARWFDGARLNYAEHVLDRGPRTGPAMIAVARAGDRPSCPASSCAARSARWPPRCASSASARGPRRRLPAQHPRGGGRDARDDEHRRGLDRVRPRLRRRRASSTASAQVEPTVLIAVDGYRFGGREYDRRDVVAELRAALPTRARDGRSSAPCTRTRRCPTTGRVPFDDSVAEPASRRSSRCAFDASALGPVLLGHDRACRRASSRATAASSLEHLKSLGLCLDLRPGDRYFFHSSTSWMAWNYLVGGLLHGATVVLYDGSPALPRADGSGRSPRGRGRPCSGWAPRMSRLRQGRRAARATASSALRTIIPTGRRCRRAGWAWLTAQLPAGRAHRLDLRRHRRLHRVLRRQPALPVRAGEISCRWLGVAAEAWDPDGRPLVGEVGEFVVTTADAVDAGRAVERRRRRALPRRLLRHLPRRLAPGRLDHGLRGGQRRRLRPLGRHAEPRRRPDGLGRDLRGRRALSTRSPTASSSGSSCPTATTPCRSSS